MARRAAVALALQLNYPFVFYCDCDRILTGLIGILRIARVAA
jgi:hypothetical protein